MQRFFILVILAAASLFAGALQADQTCREGETQFWQSGATSSPPQWYVCRGGVYVPMYPNPPAKSHQAKGACEEWETYTTPVTYVCHSGKFVRQHH